MKVEKFYKNHVAFEDQDIRRCVYCHEPATHNVKKQWSGNLTVNFDVCYNHAKIVSHVLFAFGAHQYGKISRIRRSKNESD